MGKYRIIIEGEGSHHSPEAQATDANKVAKDTVSTLVAMGHKVETAAFGHEFDQATGQFEKVELLVAPFEVEAVGAGAGSLAEGTGAVADAESGQKTEEK